MDRLRAIVEREDVKSMATVQAASAILKFAGFEPAGKQEIRGSEGQPLQIGVVAIPAKVPSIEEWVRLQEERKAQEVEA